MHSASLNADGKYSHLCQQAISCACWAAAGLLKVCAGLAHLGALWQLDRASRYTSLLTVSFCASIAVSGGHSGNDAALSHSTKGM